jgi:hypothetical protein
LEHDHTVLGRDGPIAEGLLPESGPDILAGFGGWRQKNEAGKHGCAGLA